MAMCYHRQELYPSTAPNLKLLIKRCKERIKKRKIKVLFVGAGASGVALSSMLAYACKQRRGFVRKEGEVNNHLSGQPCFGDIALVDEVWFVDDLISTGDTLKRVRKFFPVDTICTLMRVDSQRARRAKFKEDDLIHGEE